MGDIRAFILCDRIGRLWATRQLCLLWILGIVIFLTNNGRLGQVYAGRFIGMLSASLVPMRVPPPLANYFTYHPRMHSRPRDRPNSCRRTCLPL